MNQESQLEIHKYSDLDNEETPIEKEIDELIKERERLKKKRELEEKRQELLEEKESLKEDIEDTKRGINSGRDTSVFWNILLLIVLVLVAGGLIAEGKVMGRYAIILLIAVAVLIFKVLDRFKK